MANDPGYTLTRTSAQRIGELMDDMEARRPSDRLPRRNDLGQGSSNVQLVQIDSFTKVGSYFPGHWWAYDAVDKTYSEKKPAWVIDSNNGSIELGVYYSAMLVGIDGRPVWSILDAVDTFWAKLNGNSDENKYGWNRVVPAIGGTFVTASGSGDLANDSIFEVNGIIELTKDRIVLAKRGFFAPSSVVVAILPAEVSGSGVDSLTPDGYYGADTGIGGGGVGSSSPDGFYGPG